MAEDAAAQLLASLPMALFVCDYDHNAPNPEHLEATHYKLYKTVREANPDLPIIMLSKPDVRSIYPDAVAINLRRREIVMATYERALAEGDTNVYFVDGYALYNDDETFTASVDGCHPNDLGFYFFYKALKPLLERLL